MSYEYDDSDELDRRNDAYECRDCGYVPTQRELNRGHCPHCPPKSKKTKGPCLGDGFCMTHPELSTFHHPDCPRF